RHCHGSQGRKAIRRGLSRSSCRSPQAGRPTSLPAFSASTCRARSASSSSSRTSSGRAAPPAPPRRGGGTPTQNPPNLANMGTHAASVALYSSLAYNPEVDFAPIGMVAGLPVLVVGKKDLPANDLKEFATYVRANADKLNMAHAGVGSITHFTCLLLNSILGVKPTLVPFNGAAPAISALIGGQVDYMCNVAPDVVQQIQGGAFKAYAIGSSKRNSALPDVP